MITTVVSTYSCRTLCCLATIICPALSPLSLCRNGFVSKEDYLTFMISRETENVDSAQEVEEAFRAITEGGDKPYVTEAQLLQVRGIMSCDHHMTVICRLEFSCHRVQLTHRQVLQLIKHSLKIHAKVIHYLMFKGAVTKQPFIT